MVSTTFTWLPKARCQKTGPQRPAIPACALQACPPMAPVNSPEPVSQEELNAWRRGFTPQAEIWNGRLAMLGLSVGIGVLVLARVVASPHG